ncbi:MAG: I78 family peptidase inhibitor [Sphingomicrobium sp.]
MRKVAILLLAAVGGCATAPAPPPSGGTCNAGPGQVFLGQAATAQNGEAIRAATGSKVLRWAAPDSMMTMEFSEQRVTVHYDADRRITRVICG